VGVAAAVAAAAAVKNFGSRSMEICEDV